MKLKNIFFSLLIFTHILPVQLTIVNDSASSFMVGYQQEGQNFIEKTINSNGQFQINELERIELLQYRSYALWHDLDIASYKQQDKDVVLNVWVQGPNWEYKFEVSENGDEGLPVQSMFEVSPEDVGLLELPQQVTPIAILLSRAEREMQGQMLSEEDATEQALLIFGLQSRKDILSFQDIEQKNQELQNQLNDKLALEQTNQEKNVIKKAKNILANYAIILKDYFQGTLQSGPATPEKSTWIEWLSETVGGLSNLKKREIKAQYQTKGPALQVRQDGALSNEEKQAIQRRINKSRLQLIKKHYLDSVNNQGKYIPKIAVICSGGGLRASIATLGWLAGAEKTGLLDIITWASTLSGSTWAVGSWMQSLTQNPNQTVNQYRQKFFNNISNNPFTNVWQPDNYSLVSNLFNIDYAFDRTVNAVNKWGAAIANTLLHNFGNEKQLQHLSAQAAVVEKGNVPIPLYTAISPERETWYEMANKIISTVSGVEYSDEDLEKLKNKGAVSWVEFTPWEVSILPHAINEHTFSIPMKGLGKQYQNGLSIDQAPEISLGFAFGIFGSAMALSFRSFVEKMVNKDLGKGIHETLPTGISSAASTYGAVPNFTRGVEGARGRFSDNNTLRLVDAGLDINLPYPSMSGIRPERQPDIIIFVDASEGVWKGKFSNIEKMKKYTEGKRLKLPESLYNADSKGLTNNAVSIFNSTQEGEPTIIYMPLTKDSKIDTMIENNSDLKTLKLDSYDKVNLEKCCFTNKGIQTAKGLGKVGGTYSYEEAMQISKIMELNIRANQDKIWKTIKGFVGKEPGLQKQLKSEFEKLAKKKREKELLEARSRETARQLREAAEQQTVVRPPKSTFRPEPLVPEKRDDIDID